MQLFLVVSKLNSQAVTNTAESCRLNFPVVDGISIKTDAIVEALLHVIASRAEVMHAYLGYVVVMEVYHLKDKDLI